MEKKVSFRSTLNKLCEQHPSSGPGPLRSVLSVIKEYV